MVDLGAHKPANWLYAALPSIFRAQLSLRVGNYALIVGLFPNGPHDDQCEKQRYRR